MRNVGFVKVEQEEDECVVHIHGKGLRMGSEKSLMIYLLFESEGKCFGIWQGEADNINPAVNECISYTAEDTVEIDCHGSVLMMKRILETVIKYGARPAQPGEFTKRAFLNGRIEYGIWNEYFGISFVTSVLTRENYLIRRTFPAIDFEGSA